MDDLLKNILEDKTSGSTDLLHKISDLVRRNIDDESKLKEIIKIVKNKLPGFELISGYISELENNLDNESFRESIRNGNIPHNPVKEIYNNAFHLTASISKVFTLSNSRMVTEFIKLLHKDKPDLIVTVAESRPGVEGRITASELYKEKIKVRLVTDAAMAVHIAGSDAVFCGADKILANGNAVNKTGSLAAAVLCRYYNKPFYIIAQKEKFSSNNNFIQTEGSASEIWDDPNSGPDIINNYFEIIDSRLITGIFTNTDITK